MQQSKVYSRSTFSHESVKLTENILCEISKLKNVQKCEKYLHIF